MKSFYSLAVKKIKRDNEKKKRRWMNSRGVLGMETAGEVFKFALILAVLAIAVFLALSSLQDANLFTTGSSNANNTDDVINNVTGGVVTFFASIGTVFSILIAVVIILAVVLILLAIRRFSGGAAGGL